MPNFFSICIATIQDQKKRRWEDAWAQAYSYVSVYPRTAKTRYTPEITQPIRRFAANAHQEDESSALSSLTYGQVLPGTDGETTAQGLDGLGARCAVYYANGQRQVLPGTDGEMRSYA
jgi:hypothetical protein